MCCSALNIGDSSLPGPILGLPKPLIPLCGRDTVTKKSQISPLTRAGTVSLFAAADTHEASLLQSFIARFRSPRCRFGGEEPARFRHGLRLAVGNSSRGIVEWEMRARESLGSLLPSEDRRLKLGGRKMGLYCKECYKCWRQKKNCILSLLLGEGKIAAAGLFRRRLQRRKHENPC